jgi:hypothetical protein
LAEPDAVVLPVATQRWVRRSAWGIVVERKFEPGAPRHLSGQHVADRRQRREEMVSWILALAGELPSGFHVLRLQQEGAEEPEHRPPVVAVVQVSLDQKPAAVHSVDLLG